MGTLSAPNRKKTVNWPAWPNLCTACVILFGATGLTPLWPAAAPEQPLPKPSAIEPAVDQLEVIQRFSGTATPTVSPMLEPNMLPCPIDQ
jgi:hypothetical protein